MRLLGWGELLLAIAFEIAGTTAMKLSNGLTRPLPSMAILGCYTVSLALATLSVRTIPVGTAYAVWSGLGTVAIVTIGALWFQEPLGALKLASLALVILGVIGLNLTVLRGQ
ncbi:MAG TPA: multidrug efflux SMR transporter [Candidatus Dormibacteraeota bacterium]|nr:multidrug efflux SMR transporter [Candidatus Dormibacteraeota bacterium]